MLCCFLDCCHGDSDSCEQSFLIGGIPLRKALQSFVPDLGGREALRGFGTEPLLRHGDEGHEGLGEEDLRHEGGCHEGHEEGSQEGLMTEYRMTLATGYFDNLSMIVDALSHCFH